MLNNSNKIDLSFAPNVQPDCNVDTSDSYVDLCKAYASKGAPVEVDFRSMVAWLKKGDQLTHQIHTYPAKLLPHIAHFFVRASVFFRDSRIVLDPFCGSGTVALEASLAGCTPYVADINPLALMLASVKTQPFDVEQLRAQTALILRKYRLYKTAPEIDVVNAELWYSVGIKKELEKIIRAIRAVTEGASLDFFLVCFSVTARKLSYADPSISVPVRFREKEKFSNEVNSRIRQRLEWIDSVSAIDEFLRVCEANVVRVHEANIEKDNREASQLVGRDARDLRDPVSPARKLASGSVPLIITSPPYGSAQKYIRASSLSLNWLQMTGPDGLSALEGKSIGREHVPAYRDGIANGRVLPNKYQELIERIAAVNLTRATITKKYLEEMDSVVAEMVRVLAPGGRAVIVVGNNQVCGHLLRNDEYLIDRFAFYGVSFELSLLDDIKSRGLMTKRNRTASVISRESVLVFKKEG